MNNSTPCPRLLRALPRDGSLSLAALSLSAALLLASASASCTELEDRTVDLRAPVSSSESIAYVDDANDELLVVLPTKTGAEVRRTPLGGPTDRTAVFRALPDGAGFLAIDVPESAKVEDVEETLRLFAPDGTVTDELPLDGAFDQVTYSPDGRWAILWFGNDDGQPLQNANLVSVVDLQAKTARSFTLNGFGGRLVSVQFPEYSEPQSTPGVLVGPTRRELVAFLAEDEVVLADLAHPDADQVAVNFGADLGFIPTETLIRPANSSFPEPVLLVRGQFDTDVAMLTLVDQADELTGEPGFTAQIGLLPTGFGITDILTHDSDEAAYVIGVDSPSRALSFVDLATQSGFEIDLAAPITSAFLRTHEKLGDTVPQIVAWAQGGDALHLLDLDDIESSLGRKPRTVKIETGIGSVTRLADDRVLVGSSSFLYVVDLQSEQVTPLQAKVSYDPSRSVLDGDRLLLATPQQPWLSTVDLLSLDPRNVLVDRPISSFHFLTGPRVIVLDHESAYGMMTVLDGDEPSRENAVLFWGFAVEGVFDELETK